MSPSEELYTIDEWHKELTEALDSYVKSRKRMTAKSTNEYPDKMTFRAWTEDFDWWGSY